MQKDVVELPFESLYLKEVDSTNNYAKLHADELLHGTAVVAHAQTAGRGRLPGRTFYSPAGNGVYMTLILKEGLTPAFFARLTQTAAVAVAEALASVAAVEPQIKWVNDILLGGKKVAGILAETAVAGTVVTAFIGIGINICGTDFPPELCEKATSLEAVTGKPFTVEAVLAAVLARLEQYLNADGTAVLSIYRSRSAVLGKVVTVMPNHAPAYSAVAEAIDENGHLIVKTADGERRVLDAGEVSLKLS